MLPELCFFINAMRKPLNGSHKMFNGNVFYMFSLIYQLATKALLTICMVMIRHSQHLVNIRERSRLWLNIEKGNSL